MRARLGVDGACGDDDGTVKEGMLRSVSASSSASVSMSEEEDEKEEEEEEEE